MAWLLVFTVSAFVLAAWVMLRAAVLNWRWSGETILRSRYLRTAWDTALVFVTVVLMQLMNTPPPEIVYKTF